MKNNYKYILLQIVFILCFQFIWGQSRFLIGSSFNLSTYKLIRAGNEYSLQQTGSGVDLSLWASLKLGSVNKKRKSVYYLSMDYTRQPRYIEIDYTYAPIRSSCTRNVLGFALETFAKESDSIPIKFSSGVGIYMAYAQDFLFSLPNNGQLPSVYAKTNYRFVEKTTGGIYYQIKSYLSPMPKFKVMIGLRLNTDLMKFSKTGPTPLYVGGSVIFGGIINIK